MTLHEHECSVLLADNAVTFACWHASSSVVRFDATLGECLRMLLTWLLLSGARLADAFLTYCQGVKTKHLRGLLSIMAEVAQLAAFKSADPSSVLGSVSATTAEHSVARSQMHYCVRRLAPFATLLSCCRVQDGSLRAMIALNVLAACAYDAPKKFVPDEITSYAKEVLKVRRLQVTLAVCIIRGVVSGRWLRARKVDFTTRLLCQAAGLPTSLRPWTRSTHYMKKQVLVRLPDFLQSNKKGGLRRRRRDFHKARGSETAF